jgi:hypothetical protein
MPIWPEQVARWHRHDFSANARNDFYDRNHVTILAIGTVTTQTGENGRIAFPSVENLLSLAETIYQAEPLLAPARFLKGKASLPSEQF